jgi:hypothetical protein
MYVLRIENDNGDFVRKINLVDIETFRSRYHAGKPSRGMEGTRN